MDTYTTIIWYQNIFPRWNSVGFLTHTTNVAIFESSSNRLVRKKVISAPWKD